jgi:hypothetical protein
VIRFGHRGFDVPRGRPATGRFGASVFFLLFFAAGSFFEVVTIVEFARAMGQRSWRQVPCRIVDSEVGEAGDSENPYVFGVRYEYEYGDRLRTSSTYRRGYRGSEKYSDVQQLVQKYPAGQDVSCYVNPEDPDEAVLKRDSLLMGLIVFFPLIFMAIGGGGLYFTWRKKPERPEPIISRSVRAKGTGKYALAGFFAIFGVVGLAVLYPLGIRPIARTVDAESWAATPCKVLRAEVHSHDSDDGTTYSVYILYEYEFGGTVYKADRYDFVGGSSSGYKGKARIVDEYRAATEPICYVNPRNPFESVLKRGFHAKLLFALFPLPFILVGVIGVFYTVRSKKWTADGRRSWRPSGAEKGSDRIAVLGRVDMGPSVLTPRHTPAIKFAGAILIALFWNGIVSIFVVQAVNSFRTDDPAWFMALFMLPFVVIGIGLLGLVVYQFLAMFNPRPTLELSSSTIPLGGAVELRWRFAGNAQRIRTLTVTLRGTEQATYRRGTKTHTDTSTFYEMELYRTSNPIDVASGQVGFVLPDDTMHSFEAENNKIVWSLDLHGDIERWPDVKESFSIFVLPAPCPVRSA